MHLKCDNLKSSVWYCAIHQVSSLDNLDIQVNEKDLGQILEQEKRIFLPFRGRYFSCPDLLEQFAFLLDDDSSSLVMPRARPILVATYSQAIRNMVFM